jgi:hypothetical protein
VPTDAIVVLKEDHNEIRGLFCKPPTNRRERIDTPGQIVDRILEALTVHTYIEDEVIYPQVRELLADLGEDVLESYEEHHVADLLCSELAALDPDSDRFHAKTMVLNESVTHHMDEGQQGANLSCAGLPPARGATAAGYSTERIRAAGSDLAARGQAAHG